MTVERVERLERRVLGAIEFVDAITGARVRAPLNVTGEGLRLARNASGLYVMLAAKGFEAYTQAFASPPQPSPGAPPVFSVAVEDPRRRYLGRRLSFPLPRKNAPEHDADSALAPLVAELYPSAAMPVAANWALLRVSVRRAGHPETGLGNVLVRLAPRPQGLSARMAITDARGEALLAVPGAPPVMPSEGGGAEGGEPVLTEQFTAALNAVSDPQAVRPEGGALLLPDPQAILDRAQAPQPGVRLIAAPDVTLSAGRAAHALIEVPWP
jgi:hypothetical protein